MEWEDAQDIQKDLKKVLQVLDLPYIQINRIFCYRTTGSKVRAYARTWAMPKIFQRALGIQPAYIIEVLSKHYDKLGEDDKKKVLIHELLHIPKNFSGALLPHRTRSRNLHSLANQLFKEYKKKTNKF
ncbi:metallopeptidase [Patescibacteria group bacterium]|nr:metallopeptidase [Patescibacteria group bacterium]MBU4098112.1 metallopeptidase [Patescibacteria group bacterium]